VEVVDEVDVVEVDVVVLVVLVVSVSSGQSYAPAPQQCTVPFDFKIQVRE
jgi:hypothetical protein